MWRRLVQALLLSSLFGVLGLALVFWLGKIRLEQLLLIRQLSLRSLLFAVTALLTSFVFAALRLQHYCRRLHHHLKLRHAIRTHILGCFSASVTPSGSGAQPAIALTLQYHGLTTGQAWAVGIALFVADILFFLWSLPVALVFLRLHGIYPATPLATAVAVASVLIAALLAYLTIYRLNWLVPLSRWLFRGVLLRFRRGALRFVDSLLESNHHFTGAPWNFYAVGQIWTLLSWFTSFQILTLLALGLDIKVPVLASSAWQIVTNALAFVVPTPGGSGFFELGTSFLLLGRGHDEVVPAILLTWRVLTFYLFFLLGPVFGGYLILKSLSEHPQAAK